jgi:hypothetical protein
MSFMPTPLGTPQTLFTVAIVALIAWRLYSRVRRSLGRQRLSAVRPWSTVTILPLIIALLALQSRTQPLVGVALACGVASGIALGVLGVRLTRFEASADGLYYTPSAHLGIALSTLLVCRVLWRFLVDGLPGAPGAAPQPDHVLTPLTVLLVATLAGYYVTYAIGLLRWSFRSRHLAPESS